MMIPEKRISISKKFNSGIALAPWIGYYVNGYYVVLIATTIIPVVGSTKDVIENEGNNFTKCA